MADRYIHGHHPSVLQSHTWRTAENSAAYLLPELTPAMTILDVGCGPGTITAGPAERGPDGHVTPIDAVPEIVAKAAPHLPRPNPTFAPPDVYALAVPDRRLYVPH